MQLQLFLRWKQRLYAFINQSIKSIKVKAALWSQSKTFEIIGLIGTSNDTI